MHESATPLTTQSWISILWWRFSSYPRKNAWPRWAAGRSSYPRLEVLLKNPIITWLQKYVSLFCYSIKIAILCLQMCKSPSWFMHRDVWIVDIVFSWKVFGLFTCAHQMWFRSRFKVFIITRYIHANRNSCTCMYIPALTLHFCS